MILILLHPLVCAGVPDSAIVFSESRVVCLTSFLVAYICIWLLFAPKIQCVFFNDFEHASPLDLCRCSWLWVFSESCVVCPASFLVTSTLWCAASCSRRGSVSLWAQGPVSLLTARRREFSGSGWLATGVSGSGNVDWQSLEISLLLSAKIVLKQNSSVDWLGPGGGGRGWVGGGIWEMNHEINGQDHCTLGIKASVFERHVSSDTRFCCFAQCAEFVLLGSSFQASLPGVRNTQHAQ